MILIDTNLLVYMFDDRDPERQKRALEVVTTLGELSIGCLSAQCLSEFYSATTRGAHPILTPEDAAEQAGLIAQAFPVFPVTSQVVMEAIRGVSEYQFSFWDAQIWAVARLNQTPTIFSEDFSPGTETESVRFANPFAADFDLDRWWN